MCYYVVYFFINEDKSRYISIGFYPSEGYQPRVEFGGAKIRPIKLMEQHVAILAEHLPPLCTALCANKQYSSGVHDGFYISTTGNYMVAWLHMGPHTQISFKLPDLRYLNYIMPLVQNQLIYNNALPDIMTYAISALASSDYIEPQPTYNKNIYTQLHEQRKTLLI